MARTWQDETTCRRGAEQRPTVFSLRLGKFRVVVLSSHRDFPGKWVMHLQPGLVDTQPLEVETLEAAQQKALAIARGIFEQALADMPVDGERKQ